MAANIINETTIAFSKDLPKKSFDNVGDPTSHHPSSATALSKGNKWVWDIGFGVFRFILVDLGRNNLRNNFFRKGETLH